MATRRMPDHIADHVIDLDLEDAQKIKPQIQRLVREYGPVTIERRNTYESIYRTEVGPEYVRLTLTHLQHAFLDGAVGEALIHVDDYSQTEEGQAYIKAGFEAPVFRHNPIDMLNFDATGCCGISMSSNGTKVLWCPKCGERVLLT